MSERDLSHWKLPVTADTDQIGHLLKEAVFIATHCESIENLSSLPVLKREALIKAGKLLKEFEKKCSENRLNPNSFELFDSDKANEEFRRFYWSDQ